MPREPNEKIVQAENLFESGMAMVDIAKKLGVSDGTVRSWKNRYGWGKSSKKNNCNVAKSGDKEAATLQKKKRGGQPGNKNSKGKSKGKGNPNPHPPPDRTKHGGYVPVFMDTLDEDERELVGTVPDDEEKLLMEQIQLFSIRERRILQAINKYRNDKSSVVLVFSQRGENKRSFDNDEDKAEYERRIQEKIKSGDRLPGNEYSILTQTDNKDNIIVRLEQELSNVQNKKTKAIEALSKIRLEKKRLEKEKTENDTVDDWISAILGEIGVDE